MYMQELQVRTGRRHPSSHPFWIGIGGSIRIAHLRFTTGRWRLRVLPSTEPLESSKVSELVRSNSTTGYHQLNKVPIVTGQSNEGETVTRVATLGTTGFRKFQ